MSIIATLALSAALVHPTCSWDNPGANRYTGSIRDAIEHYQDIPKPIRERLQQRVGTHQYDDLVEIRRESIIGRDEYNPEIRDMHFGQRSVCATVSRTKWKGSEVQDGLVYCEENHCILVPSICGNVSRIVRKSQAVAKRSGTESTGGGAMILSSPPPPVVAFVPTMALPPMVEQTGSPFRTTSFDTSHTGGGGWYPIMPPIIPAVPEPTQWELIIVGLVGLALVMWYRKR